MMNRIRTLGLAVALGSMLLLPAVSCLEESPYYDPQRFTSGAGPSGTAAFISGEASKTGLKPVKEGARAPTGGADADGGTIGKDIGEAPEVAPETTDDNDGVTDFFPES